MNDLVSLHRRGMTLGALCVISMLLFVLGLSLLTGQIITNAEFEHIVRVQTSSDSSRLERDQANDSLQRLKFYRHTAFRPWVTSLVDDYR